MGRLARDLPGYLRTPMTVARAAAEVRAGIQNREAQFLQTFERTVLRHPGSPYHRLLAAAGCQPGDVRVLVTRQGVDSALAALADAGVYVTPDEFKGRADAVRGSWRGRFRPEEFDSPLSQGHFVAQTGGSRGRAVRVLRSLASVEELAGVLALGLEAHGVRNPAHVFWFTIMAARLLSAAMLRQPVLGWFQPLRPVPWQVRGAIAGMRLLLRAQGHRVPAPVHCDPADAERVARWLCGPEVAGRPILFTTMTSPALRVAVAAEAAGLDLSHVTFVAAGEPLTPARRRSLTATGAGVIAQYASTETSTIGQGCAQPAAPDDLHLLHDRFALLVRPREAIVGGPLVDSLYLTALSSSTAKIAINLELGDTARVEERDCGCYLGTLGLRTHLSGIRSFEKLSSEGTSFARSNFEQIIEQVLPGRFGGTALDYQIVEEEDAQGIGRLTLRVHPSVGPLDDAAIVTTVLEELGRGSLLGQHQAALLRRVEALTVVRTPPITTAAGKVLPFHLAARSRTEQR